MHKGVFNFNYSSESEVALYSGFNLQFPDD